MANLEIGEKQLSSMTSYWKERKAERQAYKLKKRSKKDLQYVVIAGQEKRLDKLMNNLKKEAEHLQFLPLVKLLSLLCSYPQTFHSYL